MIARVVLAISREDLLADPRFANDDLRGENGEELYGAVFAPDSLLTPATVHTNLRAEELQDLLVQKVGLVPEF